MIKPQAFQDVAENLAFLDDWEDRYRYLIELGQALPALAPAERNTANKVNGCVSQVWLVSERSEDNGVPRLRYRGESDAMIVRGLVAMLVTLYSGQPSGLLPLHVAEVLYVYAYASMMHNGDESDPIRTVRGGGYVFGER